ncbi:PREDICTED: perilipin-2-like isoform X1 [Gavialis gangeticus]|uniref:perilipin-2-like isoform X1 n=2 Tax=Gavialis gangeticus TaxID=94835 RepID=UPI00092F9CCA|nr:PREDICTED: perilipin-2-like isoform X1 [Gavialis gangeticus]XP_019372246.1 PREDICTED: perilipin-2-like isoform X1 [Gavialis gangeticus]
MSSKKARLNMPCSENWEQKKQLDVFKKVTGPPFISSVRHLVSFKYTSIKKKHSCLKSMCTGAKKGMKINTSVTVIRAQPILTPHEHQSLDSVEEELPVVHQTPDQVVSDIKDLMSSQVTDAKITTVRTMGVMDLTKDAHLCDSLETKKPDSTNSMTPVAESRSSLNDTNKAHTMLEKFEEMVNLYFPTPDEVVKPTALADRHGIASVQKQEDYSSHLLVYLRTIMTKLQQYACQCSQGKVKDASQSMREALQTSCLLLKHWIIALIHPIIHLLKSMYLGLLLSIEEFPINFQGKVQQVSNTMEMLQASFSFFDSFLDLSRRILSPAWKRLTKKYESLSELQENVVYNAPLSWFVAPLKTLRGRT